MEHRTAEPLATDSLKVGETNKLEGTVIRPFRLVRFLTVAIAWERAKLNQSRVDPQSVIKIAFAFPSEVNTTAYVFEYNLAG